MAIIKDIAPDREEREIEGGDFGAKDGRRSGFWSRGRRKKKGRKWGPRDCLRRHETNRLHFSIRERAESRQHTYLKRDEQRRADLRPNPHRLCSKRSKWQFVTNDEGSRFSHRSGEFCCGELLGPHCSQYYLKQIFDSL